MKNILVANFNEQDSRPETSGTFFECSWRSVDTRRSLGQLFRLRKDEMISAIIITENGLKVKIVSEDELNRKV